MIKMINFMNKCGERQIITNVHTIRADFNDYDDELNYMNDRGLESRLNKLGNNGG